MKDFKQNQDMDKTDQAKDNKVSCKDNKASCFDHHLQKEFEVSIADAVSVVFLGLQNFFTANPNCFICFNKIWFIDLIQKKPGTPFYFKLREHSRHSRRVLHQPHQQRQKPNGQNRVAPVSVSILQDTADF